MNIYKYKIICCTPETTTMLCVNYVLIKIPERIKRKLQKFIYQHRDKLYMN